jgi:Xaa-Pro aminopeptidase
MAQHDTPSQQSSSAAPSSGMPVGSPYSRRMPDLHAARRALCQQKIAALGADAALITNLINVRYLTGLASSNAALLLLADGRGVLATDSRYAPAAARDCPDVELLVERYTEPALAARSVSAHMSRVAFESQEMTVERYQALVSAGSGPELIPLGHAVEELRTIKDRGEIELLARACAITCAALDEVVPQLRPGTTERQFAISLERAMTDLGAEAPAFDSIVASGPNGATPHHVPTDRPFAAGDLVTIDCGARFGGYHADMTRTVAIGEPSAWQREIYDLVAAAQAAGVAAARDGMSAAGLDAIARGMIADAGYGEYFQHGLGHGVGLEIHEAPMIGYGQEGTLTDRVPVTVEPGVYLPGKGGVRIEDTLVVRAGAGAAGSAELLTTTTRELLVL